ncbi:GNS1/SUR4 family-domain-containing protein [Fennellomyces sp. T-0311]|nr:GNS1/SUR4 family-domain-containing protein [Fennellomyces sp. T-0311]
MLFGWDWQQLDPRFSAQFYFVYGKTPLSEVWVVYMSWVAYFTGIIGIRWIMAQRQRFDRKIHSWAAAYNAIMFLLVGWVWVTGVQALWSAVEGLGWSLSRMNCSRHTGEGHEFMFYSMYIYYLLRFITFFDTVILALRKKGIAFFHWYQNMVVILMLWTWLQGQSIFGSTATNIIAFVQLFRHLYFFWRSVGCQVAFLKTMLIWLEQARFGAGVALTAYQMCTCPQSSGLVLTASLNVTMIYMAVNSIDSPVATTRDLIRKGRSHKSRYVSRSRNKAVLR